MKILTPTTRTIKYLGEFLFSPESKCCLSLEKYVIESFSVNDGNSNDSVIN